LPQYLVDRASSSEVRALLFNNTQTPYSQVPTSTQLMEMVERTEKASMKERAALHSCFDNTNVQSPSAQATFLATLTRNSSITTCDANDDWLKSHCSHLNMSSLRFLCPVMCGCQDLLSQYLGFFGGSEWGCPSSCAATMSAVSEKNLLLGYYTRCQDFGLSEWVTNGMLYTYLVGLFDYLEWTNAWSALPAKMSDENTLSIIGIDQNQTSKFITHLRTRGLLTSYLRWELMPGVVHPRNLTGCDFWISFEMQLLIGLDLCAVGLFRSLRFACATACSCVVGFLEECPVSCGIAANALPNQAGEAPADFGVAKGPVQVEAEAEADPLGNQQLNLGNQQLNLGCQQSRGNNVAVVS